jgi:hypothetical protein
MSRSGEGFFARFQLQRVGRRNGVVVGVNGLPGRYMNGHSSYRIESQAASSRN